MDKNTTRKGFLGFSFLISLIIGAGVLFTTLSFWLSFVVAVAFILTCHSTMNWATHGKINPFYDPDQPKKKLTNLSNGQ